MLLNILPGINTDRALRVEFKAESAGSASLRTATIGSIIPISGRRYYLAPALSTRLMKGAGAQPEDRECIFDGFDIDAVNDPSGKKEHSADASNLHVDLASEEQVRRNNHGQRYDLDARRGPYMQSVDLDYCLIEEVENEQPNSAGLPVLTRENVSCPAQENVDVMATTGQGKVHKGVLSNSGPVM